MRVIWSPAEAMATVARERRLGTGFGVIVLAALLGLIVSAVSIFAGTSGTQLNPQDFPTIPPDTLRSMESFIKVGIPVISVVVPFVWWIGVTLVMQLVTRFFGGNGPFSAMFAVIGVAYVPLLVGSLINFLLTGLRVAVGTQSSAAVAIGLISTVLILAFLVWHVALIIVGASFAREISYGQSGGSCAISCVGFVVLIVLLILAIILIIAFATGGLNVR